MSKRYFLFSTIYVFLLFMFCNLQAQPIIDVTTPMAPPAWAFMERELLKENVRFMEVYIDKYVNPVSGHLECVEHWGGSDGPDDAMENFYNWSLLYALGAPKRALDLTNFIWNGHIDQYSKLGMFYKEYITSFDWEHNGEGYETFLLLPLSDPEDWKTQQRIVRFADFYTGRDTLTHNYDPVHKIIRSAHNGSKGPRMTATIEDWGPNNDAFWKGNGEYWRDWTREMRGDILMNLISTSLGVNAYLLTGDEHYKNWVLEYIGAWRDRAIANNGIIPSNIGLNGIVGEHWDGKWYGGLMGWNWKPFGGWAIFGAAVIIGFDNAYLLTGDIKYIDLVRQQVDMLLQNRKEGKDGRLMIPSKYGEEGWYDYSISELYQFHFANLYNATLEEQDLKRFYDLTQNRAIKPYWIQYEFGSEFDWFEFLQGRNPEFPVKTLQNAFERLRSGVEGIRKDKSTADTRQSDHPPQDNAKVATAALVNLTMGGLQPVWTGGLLHARLRYFDPVNHRPGLPEDVGALVTKMNKEMTKVILVNVSQLESREVMVQTGGYGEHQCLQAEIGGKIIPVNNRFFTFRLAPGAGAEVNIYMKWHANKPTLAFPWHGDRVPNSISIK